MMKYFIGISFIVLIGSLGGCSSSPKKKQGKFKGVVIKRPSLNPGSFWGKRLVALIQSPGAVLDTSSLGKNCGMKAGLQGINECLLLGADINLKTEGGITALVAAVLREDLDMVKSLLKAGAQIDLADNQGQTPLMHASRLGNFELVETLVLKGASLGPTIVGEYKGMRALDMAEFYLNKKVASYLRLKMGWPLVD